MTHLPEKAGLRQWLALGVLTFTVILLAVDGTVLALAVPALTMALEPTATQLLWIGDIYSFALAGLLITMGNLADRIGRKRLLLIGAVGFGVASVLAAFSPTAEVLIAARALLGVFGATLMPSTLSIIRNMFLDAAQRTRAIAIWSAGATAGAALGPLIGGILLERFWWGAVFLINVPVMIIVVALGIFLLPESKNPAASPIDLGSAVLSIGAIVPAVFAIKQLLGTGTASVALVALLISVGCGWWFVRRQQRLPQPLVDIDLFRLPAFSGAVIANTVAIFALSGLLFFFSQYLQLVRGFRPVLAGVAELPLTFASIVVIVIIGRLVIWWGRGRAIAIGLFLGSTGLGLLAIAESLPGYLWIGLALIPIGLGVGIASTLATDAVVASAPRTRAGAAASIAETAYELGIALGIAVLGSLQMLFYRSQLDLGSNIPDQTQEIMRDSLATASRELSGTQYASLIGDAQHAFTVAMQATSVAAAFLVAAAGILAWKLIPNEDIGGKSKASPGQVPMI